MDTCTPTVFHELEREWEHLMRRRQFDTALAAWQASEPCLTEFDSIQAVLDALREDGADHERQSVILLALLRQARTDRRAARLVLQRFLPAMKLIAGWEQPVDRVEWAATIVSSAWETITTYPIERRPMRVAGNIAWDIRKRMYAELREQRRWQAELVDTTPEERSGVARFVDRLEAVDVLTRASRAAGLSPEDEAVIVLTRVAGVQVKELAACWGVPSSRLRQRRLRWECRLREAIATGA